MECMTKSEVALLGIEATSLWVGVLIVLEMHAQDRGSTYGSILFQPAVFKALIDGRVWLAF